LLIKDIAKYLDGLGYGNYYETGFNPANNIFLNHLPTTPNNLIAIYETGGRKNDVGMPDISRSIQILVRDESMTQANYIIWAIFNAMTNFAENGFLFINGRKMLITAINPPVSIGKDANGFFEYSVNFSIYTQSDV
jgi:hypothetical protein